MIRRLLSVAFAVFVCVAGGCGAASAAGPGVGPVVVVSATYPGADASTVADVVAAPLEQQINGVEKLIRIESISRNDGTYEARVLFNRDIEPAMARSLVQARAALADPILPEAVRKAGVAVKLADPPAAATGKVTIALVARGDVTRAELRNAADAVSKQLTTPGSKPPELFPGADERRLRATIDSAKCKELGLTEKSIDEAIAAAEKAAPADLLKLMVKSAAGADVAIGDVATIEEVLAPAGAFRINLYPAVRISDAPLGKTPREAAQEWIKRLQPTLPAGYALEDLTQQ